MAKQKLDLTKALMRTGANVTGGVSAAALNKIPFVAKQKMMIRGAAKLALSVLPSFLKLKGSTGEMVNDAAAGFAAVAGIEMVNGILTKNGENPDKALSISGIGNYTPSESQYDAPADYRIMGDQDEAPETEIM